MEQFLFFKIWSKYFLWNKFKKEFYKNQNWGTGIWQSSMSGFWPWNHSSANHQSWLQCELAGAVVQPGLSITCPGFSDLPMVVMNWLAQIGPAPDLTQSYASRYQVWPAWTTPSLGPCAHPKGLCPDKGTQSPIRRKEDRPRWAEMWWGVAALGLPDSQHESESSQEPVTPAHHSDSSCQLFHRANQIWSCRDFYFVKAIPFSLAKGLYFK